MSEEVLRKIKSVAIFLMSAFVMIWGYSKGADNTRSLNREVTSERDNSEKSVSHPIIIEGDMPEISSGTQ